MESYRRVVLGAVCVAMLAYGGVGCRASECTKMSECCGDVREMDGLGDSCGPLAEQTTNPDSCRSVTETVRYMLKDRKKEVPRSCQ